MNRICRNNADQISASVSALVSMRCTASMENAPSSSAFFCFFFLSFVLLAFFFSVDETIRGSFFFFFDMTCLWLAFQSGRQAITDSWLDTEIHEAIRAEDYGCVLKLLYPENLSSKVNLLDIATSRAMVQFLKTQGHVRTNQHNVFREVFGLPVHPCATSFEKAHFSHIFFCGTGKDLRAHFERRLRNEAQGKWDPVDVSKHPVVCNIILELLQNALCQFLDTFLPRGCPGSVVSSYAVDVKAI